MVTAAVILAAGVGHAAPNGPAETSLDKCQNALRSEGVKYVQNSQKAIATCLGKVSTEVLKKNAPTVAAALAACTAQFNKIGRTDGKSIGDAFAAKVGARCNPAPTNAHTLDDLLGTGSPGVAEPLDAGANLGALCATYGGDGSVDSPAEWIACMRAAQDCSVRSAIAAEFPRTLEWLNDLAAAMPPSAARNAVIAAEAAIDGASDDGVPSLQCGSTCGDDVKVATEQCDVRTSRVPPARASATRPVRSAAARPAATTPRPARAASSRPDRPRAGAATPTRPFRFLAPVLTTTATPRAARRSPTATTATARSATRTPGSCGRRSRTTAR